MPTQHSRFVEVFLAAADFAAQVAFVGQTETAIDRRRDLVATVRPEERRLGMQVPERCQALEEGALPSRQIERKIDLVAAAVGIRIRVV
jgi:hypothetical protein